MDPLIFFQKFPRSVSVSDEKPTPPATTSTSPLIQTPENGTSNNNEYLLANSVEPVDQIRSAPSLLQQYLYANYIQQLAQQQQLASINPTMLMSSFSPHQATTIPQSILVSDMNRKRKLAEEAMPTPPKQGFLPSYMPILTSPSTVIRSIEVPSSVPESWAKRSFVPPSCLKQDVGLPMQPKAESPLTPEQIQIYQQFLAQYKLQLESQSQQEASSIAGSPLLPRSKLTTPLSHIASPDIRQEQLGDVRSREPSEANNTISSTSASPTSTENSQSSLISLLKAPIPRNNSEETADEQEDLDIVDVVGGIPGDKGSTAVRSVQRKAHIEFYRKLKSFRNRENVLTCNLCQVSVENSDNGIRSHIHLHSHVPLFVCKICQVGFKERHRIFEHLKDRHPGKTAECFVEDRRDMVHLGEVLFNCFPKGNPKAKVSYQDLMKKITQYASREKLSKLECQICNSKISSQRNSIVQHLHNHPTFRCKCCKFTCQSEAEQVQHCKKEHNSPDPKPSAEYNVCGAQEVLVSTFEQCFSSYLTLMESNTTGDLDAQS